MVLSIPARVTVTFGATNGFHHLPSPSRVTKLLAQFASGTPRRLSQIVVDGWGFTGNIARLTFSHGNERTKLWQSESQLTGLDASVGWSSALSLNRACWARTFRSSPSGTSCRLIILPTF